MSAKSASSCAGARGSRPAPPSDHLRLLLPRDRLVELRARLRRRAAAIAVAAAAAAAAAAKVRVAHKLARVEKVLGPVVVVGAKVAVGAVGLAERDAAVREAAHHRRRRRVVRVRQREARVAHLPLPLALEALDELVLRRHVLVGLAEAAVGEDVGAVLRWCSTSSVSRRIWSERARACSVVRRLCVDFLPSTLCLRRSVCRDSKAEGRPADARTASLTLPPALGIAVELRGAALATESTTTTRSRAESEFLPRG